MVFVSPAVFDSLIDPEHAWKKSTDKFLESIGARVSNKSNKNRAAVEHTPHDKEVVGSNPAGCWAFFLFSILS